MSAHVRVVVYILFHKQSSKFSTTYNKLFMYFNLVLLYTDNYINVVNSNNTPLLIYDDKRTTFLLHAYMTNK